MTLRGYHNRIEFTCCTNESTCRLLSQEQTSKLFYEVSFSCLRARMLTLETESLYGCITKHYYRQHQPQHDAHHGFLLHGRHSSSTVAYYTAF